MNAELNGALRQMYQISGEPVPTRGFRPEEFYQEMGRLMNEAWPPKHNALVAKLREKENSAREHESKARKRLMISQLLSIVGLVLITLKDILPRLRTTIEFLRS